jgi:uncharacterized membrane protein
MDFKLVSKNNMGVVATLILVILLSQSRFFNFLIDTALGRAVLILFILGISYINQILGVVAVLFIIIMFNQSDIGYIEGFTSTTTTPTTSTTTNDNLKLKEQEDKLKIKEDKLKMQKNKLQQTTTTTTASSVAAASPLTATKGETFIAREGFNMIDREGTMLRGKRSNEVPVFSGSHSQNDDVEPSDKSVFTSTYSSI